MDEIQKYFGDHNKPEAGQIQSYLTYVWHDKLNESDGDTNQV